MRNSRRIGFTLVELLVVIAIIGILIALLLPAGSVVNFAFCDGHVQSLGITIDHGLYQALGTRANGEVIDGDFQ